MEAVAFGERRECYGKTVVKYTFFLLNFSGHISQLKFCIYQFISDYKLYDYGPSATELSRIVKVEFASSPKGEMIPMQT